MLTENCNYQFVDYNTLKNMKKGLKIVSFFKYCPSGSEKSLSI